MLTKTLTSLGLLLSLAWCMGEYLGFYNLGWLGTWWVYFSPFTAIFVEPVLFLFLLSGFIATLISRQDRIWSASMLCAAVVLFTITFLPVLPPPGVLVVYGIRDHVMKVAKPDDLRAFAADYARDLRYVDIDHGRAENLTDEEAASFRRMRVKYAFMNWGLGSGDGPSILLANDVVSVDWGGALPGHWGFSVTTDRAKNTPSADDYRVLRVADDIYFFHGD